MSKINSFEDLKVWQLARMLSKDIYLITQKDRFSKDFSLKDQINRSAGSTMDNIAEGFDRSSDADFSRFLYMSLGSASEVKSMIHLAERLNYIDMLVKDDLLLKSDEVSKIIRGLIKSLKPKN